VVVDNNYRRIGISIIVRNYKDIVLVARSTTRNMLAEPVVAEALTALHAIKLSREMGFNDIILERYAFQIVTVIKAEENNWSKIRHIVDRIKKGLRQLRS